MAITVDGNGEILSNGYPLHAIFVNDLGNQSGPTLSLDFSSGEYIKFGLLGDVTVTLQSLDSAIAQKVQVEILQPAGESGHSVSWSTSNIKFPGGVIPPVSPFTGRSDYLEFQWNGTEFLLVNYISDLS